MGSYFFTYMGKKCCDCHQIRDPAKMNFKKLHQGDLKCVLKCNEDETQIHIFQKCQPVLERLGNQTIPAIDNI